MQEKLKLIKQYVQNNYKIIDITIEPHVLRYNDWYYVIIQLDDYRICKILITSSGVITFEGSGSFLVLEIMNGINYIIDDEYYSSLQEHTRDLIGLID